MKIDRVLKRKEELDALHSESKIGKMTKERNEKYTSYEEINVEETCIYTNIGPIYGKRKSVSGYYYPYDDFISRSYKYINYTYQGYAMIKDKHGVEQIAYVDTHEDVYTFDGEKFYHIDKSVDEQIQDYFEINEKKAFPERNI